jgi:hypothetical protein
METNSQLPAPAALTLEKSHPDQWDRLGGIQGRSGSWEEEKVLIIQGIKPRPYSPQPIAIQIMLSGLLVTYLIFQNSLFI